MRETACFHKGGCVVNPLIEHQAILASAGSGKTFQLAHRYIRLLAAGMEPNRIIAVTFSRKAAREIFTSIVEHLCDAASSPDKAQQTACIIEHPDFTTQDFALLLKRFLQDMQRLHISTIDSFTIGVLRAFPMELGLSPAFNVTDNGSADARQARAETLSRLFTNINQSQQERAQLLEAFKQATHQKEVKRFAAEFDQFIEHFQSAYKAMPDATAWGNAGRIWPDGCDWLAGPSSIEADLAIIRESVQSGLWNDFATGKWTSFLETMPTWHAGLPWEHIKGIMGYLFPVWHDLARGHGTVKMNKKAYELQGALAGACAHIVEYVMAVMLGAALTRTTGLYQLLAQFESAYDKTARRPGLITFDDAQYMITQGGRPLTRSPDDPTRLFIDYRLDCELDHWLIDEFQDTSDLQWQVFRNLADEILQDTSGRRSFFFVGDVKQAIYGWRGGNHNLFGQILDYYGETTIKSMPLNVSYRSSPAVLDMVNDAFTSLPPEIPEPVQTSWARYWEQHSCRTDRPPPAGYAAVLQTGETHNDKEACYRACATILQQVNPLRRGLSAAILVRQNNTAQELGNLLRKMCPDIPVAVEGQSEITDNPVALLLLSLLHYAAHPGDTRAREHIRMSPLQPHFEKGFITPQALLDQLHREGFQWFLQHWGHALREAHELDAFSLHRLHAMIDAAGDMDREGLRSVDTFIARMRAYTMPEESADASVRIMTIHKSKGLGFDLVLLPELASHTGMLARRSDQSVHIARDQEGQPAWALLMPIKDVCQQDRVLSEEIEAAEQDGCFENLCTLYVALTRAKRTVYAMVPPPPASGGTSLNFAAFLRKQLSRLSSPSDKEEAQTDDAPVRVLYEKGHANWYQEIPLVPDEEIIPDHAGEPVTFATSKRKRLSRVRPSARAEEPRPAHLFFIPNVTRSLALGSMVHQLFERVEWTETADVDAIIMDWKNKTGLSDPEAEAHFRNAMISAAVRDALSRPPVDVILWREKNFEAVVDDEWLTGTLDRAVLVKDKNNRVIHADILDYKTNEISESNKQATMDHYAPQLRLYARALALLTGLAPHQIGLHLLFTRTGDVVHV